MIESGIYIRINNKAELLEDVEEIARKEWLKSLDRGELEKVIEILCNTISTEKFEQYQDYLTELEMEDY